MLHSFWKSSIHRPARFLPWFQTWWHINVLRRGLVVNGRHAMSVDRSYQHLLLVAPSGFGKTTRYVIPNALRLKNNTSAVFTDPSGEIYDACAAHLRSRGFTIKKLDLRPEQSTLHYNPLTRVTTPSQANKIAHILLHAAYPHHAGDTFWIDGARSLISLLVLYLSQHSSGSAPTLFDLYQLLFRLSYAPKDLHRSFLQHLAPQQREAYKAFMAQDNKVITGTLSTCKAALHMLADPHVEFVTHKETLHFESLRTTPTTLFIIVAEHDLVYFQFLLALVYSQLFTSLLRMPKDAELSVRMFLDEFGNMHIPHFPTYITVLRKRRVSVSLVVQELEQLRTQYQHHAHTIMHGGCSNHLYYPGLGLDTCQKLEQTLGYCTTRKPLLSAHAIRMLPQNRALFISGNLPPVLLTTTPWYKQARLRHRVRQTS